MEQELNDLESHMNTCYCEISNILKKSGLCVKDLSTKYYDMEAELRKHFETLKINTNISGNYGDE
jgi:hypothetical protein